MGQAAHRCHLGQDVTSVPALLHPPILLCSSHDAGCQPPLPKVDLLQITACMGAHTRAHTHNQGRPRSSTPRGGLVTTVQLHTNPQVLFYSGCCSASGEPAPKTPLCPHFLVFSKDSMSLCISLRLSPPGTLCTRSLCRDAHGTS